MEHMKGHFFAHDRPRFNLLTPYINLQVIQGSFWVQKLLGLAQKQNKQKKKSFEIQD